MPEPPMSIYILGQRRMAENANRPVHRILHHWPQRTTVAHFFAEQYIGFQPLLICSAVPISNVMIKAGFGVIRPGQTVRKQSTTVKIEGLGRSLFLMLSTELQGPLLHVMGSDREKAAFQIDRQKTRIRLNKMPTIILNHILFID